MGTFAKVRTAFVGSLDANLAQLGVTCVGSPGKEWRQVVCPLCDDQNGSCDISSSSGHLKCKQCQRSSELFAWVGELLSVSKPWECCQRLAEMVGVEIEQATRRGKPPRKMTDEILDQSVNLLWSSPNAETCREFLQRRHLAHPEILEVLGVGWLGGYLTFAQKWPSGALKERYRRYLPGAPKSKLWSWSPGSGRTQGIWPMIKPPHEVQVVLLEGEFDTLTAWARLAWHLQGVYTYTWTGGVKAIPPGELPDWLSNRVVDICWDNDVFQGPDWSEHKAPNNTKLLEMKMRRDAMLQTARGLEMLGCKIRLRAIPVSPAENWGGDFRDWVDEGGRDWREVPSYTLEQVEEASKPKLVRSTFDDVYNLAGQRASFEAVVQSLEKDGITIPQHSKIDCAMGAETFCQRCRVPELFPGQVIDWSVRPDDLVAVLMSRNQQSTIYKQVLGKPAQCAYCKIEPLDYQVGSAWIAVQDDPDEASARELIVISAQSPILSGRITVHGSVHHHEGSIVVSAEKLEMQETQDVDLTKFAGKLQEICPAWQTDDTERINEAIEIRAADMARHVTHIFGRTDLHVAADLLAHSALWFNVHGHRKRGWLDVSIIGDTSTGKSMTVKLILAHHGFGQVHTCMENVSRAGLTMGAVQGRDRMKLKPGLFPRSHRGMLWLDEFHIMVEGQKENPMTHLQSARDEGHVGGIKIYGAHRLPAAVRLGTIANWVEGRSDAFKFPCEHFLALYGKPESLRRLDFGLVVTGEQADRSSDVVHQWTRELAGATLLRAWGQTADQVCILPDALQRAQDQARDWGRFYAEELPLFTGSEKLFSLLRVAISAANITFSHPDNDLHVCEVRKAHVDWAAQWFERVWALSMYDLYSSARMSKRSLNQPFHVEAHLTVKLDIKTADEALRLLDNLFGLVSSMELCTYVGKEMHHTLAWANQLVRLGGLERSAASNNYHTAWRLTTGAHTLLKSLLELAEEFPQEFHERVRELEGWVAMRAMRDAPSLKPLDDILKEKRDAWEDLDGPENIVSGPGSVDAS